MTDKQVKMIIEAAFFVTAIAAIAAVWIVTIICS